MPRNILRNRVQGCMVQSHIGGSEPDKFEVLDENQKDVLASLDTLSEASEVAKIVSAVRTLGERVQSPEKFSELAGVFNSLLQNAGASVQERVDAKAAKEAEKESEKKAAAESASQEVQSPAEVPQQQPDSGQAAATTQQPAPVPPAPVAPVAPVSQQVAVQPGVPQQPVGHPAPVQPAQQQPAPQESTNVGVDPGRVHDGGSASPAGEETGTAQPATPVAAVEPAPAVSEPVAADTGAQSAPVATPGEDGLGLL